MTESIQMVKKQESSVSTSNDAVEDLSDSEKLSLIKKLNKNLEKKEKL